MKEKERVHVISVSRKGRHVAVTRVIFNIDTRKKVSITKHLALDRKDDFVGRDKEEQEYELIY